jgi:hypothetical protein
MFMSRAKIALFIVATSLWSGEVLAGTSTFTLHRLSAVNVTDTAGTTHHEAGTVHRGDALIGYFLILRRVENALKFAIGAGTTHITLFFPAKADTTAAWENIIMDGAHKVDSSGAGAFKGSVSATSSAYSWVRDADADYTVSAGGETLVIRWAGSNQLVIP